MLSSLVKSNPNMTSLFMRRKPQPHIPTVKDDKLRVEKGVAQDLNGLALARLQCPKASWGGTDLYTRQPIVTWTYSTMIQGQGMTRGRAYSLHPTC